MRRGHNEFDARNETEIAPHKSDYDSVINLRYIARHGLSNELEVPFCYPCLDKPLAMQPRADFTIDRC